MAKTLKRRTPPTQGQAVGKAIRPSYSARLWYAKELRKLVERMVAATHSEVHALFDSKAAEQSLALDASLGSQARINMNSLAARFNKLFRDKSNELAAQMVARVDRDNRAKFGQSLREMSQDTTLPARALRQGGLPDVIKAATAENVALIRNISTEYMAQVQQTVMRAISSGNGTQDILRELSKREDITLRRARTIARDQVSKTTAVVNKARATANGVAKFKWLHSAGGREPRPLHLELDGQTFSYADPPVIDERTGERGIPGQAINCLPSGHSVSFTHGARKFFRRHFSGELTRLVTESAETLEVTPNHPVLTRRGWVAAHLVNCGEHVFKAGLQRALVIEGDVQDCEAPIDQLFDAALSSFGGGVVCAAEALLQFHGDVSDSEVDVVDVNAHLPFVLDPEQRQQVVEKLLALADAAVDADALRMHRASDQLLMAAFGPPQSVLRRLGALLAKLRAEALGADEGGFSATANVAALFEQQAPDGGAGDTVACGQFQLADATDVKRGDLLCRQILSLCAVHFDPWDVKTSGAERLGQIVSIDAEVAGDCSQVVVGLEKPLRVIEKGSREYSGHVYNLETARNWYAGAGIITHNCCCVAVPVLDFDALPDGPTNGS